MFGSNITNAYAAIEFACLDIQGKAIGRPVCDCWAGGSGIGWPFSAYVFYPAAAGDTSWEAAVSVWSTTQRLGGEVQTGSMKIKGGVHRPTRRWRRSSPAQAVPGRAHPPRPNSVWSVATSVRIARRLAEYDIDTWKTPPGAWRAWPGSRRWCPNVPLGSNMAASL